MNREVGDITRGDDSAIEIRHCCGRTFAYPTYMRYDGAALILALVLAGLSVPNAFIVNGFGFSLAHSIVTIVIWIAIQNIMIILGIVYVYRQKPEKKPAALILMGGIAAVNIIGNIIMQPVGVLILWLFAKRIEFNLGSFAIGLMACWLAMIVVMVLFVVVVCGPILIMGFLCHYFSKCHIQSRQSGYNQV